MVSVRGGWVVFSGSRALRDAEVLDVGMARAPRGEDGEAKSGSGSESESELKSGFAVELIRAPWYPDC